MINKTKQLIVLGDSCVFGWADLEGGGWCERLRCNWMKQPNAPVVYSLGVRGDGLEKVTARWSNEWHCRGELRRKVPDGVLIMVGLNDSARIGKPNGRPQLSSEAYRFGFQQLLKDIKIQTKVMIIGLTPVDEEVMPFADCLWYSNESINIYEAQIEEACLEENIPFLPIHKKMISNPFWKTWIEPDGIHLNSDGHQWIFQKLLNWNALLEWAELEHTKNVTFT